MAFSNSKLVDYVKLSPNCNKPRNNTIKKITIHHMAGNLTVETCGNVFYSTSRQASSNYGIGTDGRVGMYVEECNRSWCSSNATNDHQAITIEVANDEIGGNWHVSDKALAKLIDLCTDICQRNNIAKLNWTGAKDGNLTCHYMFASTACPGPYLKSKMPYIAAEVNKRLSATTTSIKPLSESACKLHIGPASSGDIRTIVNLVDELGIKTETASGYVITGAASKGDQVTILTECKKLGLGCKIYEEPKPQTQPVAPTTGTQATSLMSLTNEQVVAKVGPLFTADQKKTGVLASVSMAQFLVESAYGKSELAQNANNCFGMKQNLSGNTWAGSTWDGKSIYEKITKEFTEGEYIELKRPFRKYACIEDSIEDHSAYLLGAKKGAELRYAGLKGETNYKVTAQLIKNGGYATSPTYVTTLCDTIEKLGLTKYDVAVSANPTASTSTLYRVRKSWDNPSSQLGAFSSLENAKAACKSGYFVFDEKGNAVYPATTSTSSKFEKGQEVKLVAGAQYTNGKSIPSWVLKSKLYVRDIDDKGNIVFSTLKTGAITGSAAPKYFVAYTGADAFKSYKVVVNCDALNVRKGPGVFYGKVSIVRYGDELVIAQEKSGWGQIASTNNWVSLKYTKKK